MPTVLEAKAALRQEIRRRARGYGHAERVRASDALCGKIMESPDWQRAERVLLYSPLPDEPDISPLLAAALKEGKTVALPRFCVRTQSYEIAQVRDGDLKAGKFGILEPAEECGLCDMNALDLLLTPGIAFSERGQRLGRGKGYYDRLLETAPPRKCGVCFDWQVVPEVPVELHDVRVERLATPTRWISIDSRD